MLETPRLPGHKIVLYPFTAEFDHDLFVDMHVKHAKELIGRSDKDRIFEAIADTLYGYRSNDVLLWTVYSNNGEKSNVIGFVWLNNIDGHGARINGVYSPESVKNPRVRKTAHPQMSHAEEAVRLVVGYALGGLGLWRIDSEVLDTNLLSQRLLVKAGFTKEGVLRSRGFIDGELHDTELYAVVRAKEQENGRPFQKGKTADRKRTNRTRRKSGSVRGKATV